MKAQDLNANMFRQVLPILGQVFSMMDKTYQLSTLKHYTENLEFA